MSTRFGTVVAALALISGCFDAGTQDANRDSGSIEADTAYRDTAYRDTAVGDAASDASAVGDTGDDGGDEGCPSGQTVCGGECVDTQSSTDHCGACANRCEAEGVHSVATCASGACGQRCEAGWTDLDGDQATGCELECETTNGGEEVCDGVDNDCNGVIDDGFSTGVCTVGVGACAATGEFVCTSEQSAECDATPGTGSDEVCSDGVDNDCDAETDEDDAVDATTWFADTDGDGFGDAADSVTACEKPQDYVDNDTDCDDSDAGVHTSVDGYADQDGDGYTAGGVQTLCTDGTLPAGYVAAQNGDDCDDTSSAVNPGADEVCGDQIDNNCDGDIDDETAVDATLWYVDCDGDGFSADTAGSRTACELPSQGPSGCNSTTAAWTDVRPSGGSSTDCNDEADQMYPGQTAWFDEPLNPDDYYNQEWDYNCDGTMNLRWTNTGASCETNQTYLACPASGTQGWESNNLIGCGATNSYQMCETVGHNCTFGYCQSYSCDNSVVQRTQECH